ncbi:helix-turn-helix transcriptional regulator [Nocardiopsis rhodophaea]
MLAGIPGTSPGDGSKVHGDTDAGLLARRLNGLIKSTEMRESREYTNKEIAERATALGYRISPAHLSHIRRGRVRNPGFRHIEGISVALGVDVREFIVGAERRSPCDEGNEFRRISGDVDLIVRGLTGVGELNTLGWTVFIALANGILAVLKTEKPYRRGS